MQHFTWYNVSSIARGKKRATSAWWVTRYNTVSRDENILKDCLPVRGLSYFVVCGRVTYNKVSTGRVTSMEYKLLKIDGIYLYISIERVYNPICTDKKENLIFLICNEIQKGSGAKSYKNNGLLIND